MDSPPANQPTDKVKSLQDLSAAKVLEALREDDDAVQTFTSFDAAERQVLFSHLWQEFKRLMDVENKYKDIDRRISNWSTLRMLPLRLGRLDLIQCGA
ncbi:hypothetical protein H2200_012192 [Cladophialophora chaetospira]|uniref:Uncharacterized protein n=1 Tax=Cladophialophora chaetospira TaxID=386627 RepID=A0AA38WYE5_9EURO|nr:hypothetical protein H2200_012192 [Cladophialophora chaetospira]